MALEYDPCRSGSQFQFKLIFNLEPAETCPSGEIGSSYWDSGFGLSCRFGEVKVG